MTKSPMKKDKKLPRQKVWQRRPELLLGPPIPAPMHGMAPRVVLGVNWWNRTRRAAYASTNWHCVACGVFKKDAKSRAWLEAHELYEIDFLLGKMTYVEAVPLCTYCHHYCHPGRMRYLLEENKITHAKYAAIVQHGDAVLKAARLKRPEPVQLPTVAAEDWRLVIDDVEYARKDFVDA